MSENPEEELMEEALIREFVSAAFADSNDDLRPDDIGRLAQLLRDYVDHRVAAAIARAGLMETKKGPASP